MIRHRAALAFAALLGGVSLLAGCVLVAGELQTLTLTFATQRTVSAGEALEVHAAVYPHTVKLRKHFVRVSGLLIVVEGSELPESVDVSVVNQNPDTGRVLLRFRMTIEIAEDGSFSAVERYRKDIKAGTLQVVSVTPRGADIPNGSQVSVCVDVAKSRGDLENRSCAATEPPSEGRVVTIRVVDNAFEPKQVEVEPGDTVRWVLEGMSTDHTTTQMDMEWDSGFTLTQVGAVFEWTPAENHRDKTFAYSCVTHQDCCQMTGSMQVGENAPDPLDGY